MPIERFRTLVFSTLVFMGAALALASCGPVYKTEHSYFPPQSQQGLQCVAQCADQSQACQAQCAQRAQQCRHRAEDRAERNYVLALEEWSANARVQLTGLTGSARSAKLAELEKSRPSRYSYRASTSHCGRNCGCTESYNLCYSGCGGSIQTHRRCVSGCD